jgi:SAM-dependent methyltransferase
MSEYIIPGVARSKPGKVLFVGCKEYTARYGKRFTDAGIEYWTTDIDPLAGLWGQVDRHIVADITEIDDACATESFDVVLLNGVIGSGVDEENAMNQAVKAIARILRPNGILLIGWNSNKKHPDPVQLDAVRRYFRYECVLGLPTRKTFTDTDHVYDWLLKINSVEPKGA